MSWKGGRSAGWLRNLTKLPGRSNSRTVLGSLEWVRQRLEWLWCSLSAVVVEDGIMGVISALFRATGDLVNPPVPSLPIVHCTESVPFPVPFGHTPPTLPPPCPPSSASTLNFWLAG
jgi:hypothetical protein